VKEGAVSRFRLYLFFVPQKRIPPQSGLGLHLNSNTMTFKRTTSENIDFQHLVFLLDADLKIRDGDEHAFYAQFNKTDTLRHVIVYYENEKALGCGAFRDYDAQHVEIKRMFVLPENRGKGIAHAILNELERWAHELDFRGCVLETGKNQPEAIGLYQKAGYTITRNYGQYQNMENSVCMKKTLHHGS
jgi:putative acetyltransferase